MWNKADFRYDVDDDDDDFHWPTLMYPQKLLA